MSLTRVTGAGVVVGVWDGSERRPRRRQVELTVDTLDLAPRNFDDNSGWGLAIVESLAAECWTEKTPVGKFVCALLKA